MLIPARVPNPFVVVLVATRDRPVLLRRALASIAAQTRPPDALVVVEDSTKPSPDVRVAVAESDLPPGVVVLKNRRTPGASGAWNTGIDEAARRFGPAQSVYVAILDDDDWWDTTHLEDCVSRAVADDVDMVAASLVRHDEEHPDGRVQESPPRLHAAAAFVRNPHVQGSNLFVRLSTLLEAGAFDESLQSTTDRDLFVRLADIGATYSVTTGATAHHDARGARTRLSTAGSTAKTAGLAQFWAKHRLRMTEDQRRAFEERARTLFGLDAAALQPEFERAQDRTPTPENPRLDARIVLVVGITADGDARGVARVTPLLEDLLRLQNDPRVAALDVLVVENGFGDGALRERIDELIRRGLRCYLADVEQQRADADLGFFGTTFRRGEGRIGISEARSITQRYVRRLMRPGSIGWILDDDKRLDPLVVDDEGRLVRRPFDVVGAIVELRASGADVVLGVDTGAAPLPAAATLRTQLVDLSASLAAMHAMHSEVSWPDLAAENRTKAAATSDYYYYDLARTHTAHLEVPFWFEPEVPGVNVREAFKQLCERAPRILAGEQVFRPLFVEAHAPLSLRRSIRRGGNTLVFTADALVDVPQVVPSADGRPTRRSDMVWALLNAEVRGRRIEEAPFAVFHDRTDLDASTLDVASLADDIRGYALYSTLQDVALRWPGLDELGSDASVFARDRYHKYLTERTAALVLSVYRARGAARMVLRLARDPNAWWVFDPATRERASELAVFAERVLELLALPMLERLRADLAETTPLAIDRYTRALRGMLDEAATPNPVKPEWLRAERVRIAQLQVERCLPHVGPLRLLGVGHEGVVFTDEREVYKYLDLWCARASEETRAFLRSLVGRWTNTTALYPLHRLVEHGPHAILVYPYEPTEAYVGGLGPGIVGLLRDCREQGVCFRNMHPRNLRVAGDRVRLVDYGADLVPLDEAEWRHMVRRAWLVWRWAHLPNLEDLMRRALHEEIPELTGWHHLERAVLARDARADAAALILDEVLRSRAESVLDYGCGGGALVRDLADRGIHAVGFDVRASRHWHEQGRAIFTTDRERALTSGPYDAVVCSLVLCTLTSPDYESVIADLRASLRPGGVAIVAVCNPFHTHGGDTPFQHREIDPRANLDRTTVWTKHVSQTGGRREDVHRPLHILRRDLLRAGLVVESVTETETVDLDRFEPASDFLVLRARAVATGPRVSLLVRASALEWRTLGIQMRHVVEQLEGPSTFRERIVVLDSREREFAREYDQADLDASRRVLDELVAEGLIDRYVEVPTDEDTLSAMNRRWFGLAARTGHTHAGTPNAASLLGIEACIGDYILHVDDDLLVARRDRAHDYLADMCAALERDPESVCVSLNICHEEDQPWTAEGPSGPWRVEVRGTLLHRARLFASRPWPNEVHDGSVSASWYRALDARIQASGLRSLRGGSSAMFFVHPPNDRKRDRAAWFAILDRIEAGFIPAAQAGSVELRGDLDDWLGPDRREPLVVIACGRNVASGRLARFRESLEAQTLRDFGLVAIEDGGSRLSQDAIRRQFAGRSQTTVLTLRERRGALANIAWALRHVCAASTSVITLVDLDDALLGPDALERVAREFERGADLTVGGMLRTDKAAHYPVDFQKARTNRGGNVWQHLRAFRRELFDRVPDERLRLDGDYVDLAWDWALMLPLVEVASAPRVIPEPLYLYEPSGVGKSGSHRLERETIIGRLVGQPSLRGPR